MTHLLDILSKEMAVILTATLPIIELKGAIPVGIALGMAPYHAFLLAFVGSMLPVPIILFSIRPVLNYLKSTKTFRKLVERLTHKSMGKS